MNQRNLLLAQMMAMMAGFETVQREPDRSDESFEDKKNRIAGDPNNPYKKCTICDCLHRKHSAFCSDSCTRKHIKSKKS